MQNFQIIQMKKDLENHGISIVDFIRDINILHKNIVIAQRVSL